MSIEMTPLVTVVIATYHRPHLIGRSVASVLRQTVGDLEVLVIIDGVDDGTRAVVEGLGDPRTRVIETGNKRGPAAARNLGARQGNGKYLAPLDDDDEWLPDKLETELRFISDHQLQGEFLVGCRMIGMSTNCASFIIPDRIFQRGSDLSEYLMDRRLFKRTGTVSLSTLLFPRTLALRVPFPDEIVLEDWGWLLLCVVRDNVPLFTCPEPLYIYHLDSVISRNKASDWLLMIEWMRRYRDYISGVAFSGMFASSIAWRAKRQGGLRAFFEIAKVMHREGQTRFIHWLMMASVALLPLALAERLRRRVTGSPITSPRHPPTPELV